jgi:DNA-binding NarL/FixJ family response regulator
VRAAGLNASLTVGGEVADLAPGLDMSAYRIVQEALTNALWHAPGARVGVSVRYGRDLVLEVLDDGARRANGRTAAPPGSGHGLVGMRERAALTLLARGRSIQEIAAEPIVGDATVKAHVARVLMKLGLRDRVQAVVFAYEHGIVTPGDDGA